MFALNIVLLALVFGLLDRGRVMSPASRRLGEEELAGLRAIGRRERAAATMGD
jgi:hypothetical protein